MNSSIKVKLTPYGAEIYYHQFDECNKTIVSKCGTPLERRMPVIDKDGYTTFQLWCFMQLYGEYLELGKKAVVSDSSLYILESDLQEASVPN